MRCERKKFISGYWLMSCIVRSTREWYNHRFRRWSSSIEFGDFWSWSWLAHRLTLLSRRVLRQIREFLSFVFESFFDNFFLQNSSRNISHKKNVSLCRDSRWHANHIQLFLRSWSFREMFDRLTHSLWERQLDLSSLTSNEILITQILK